MSNIGSYGKNIVFRVSDKKILTFNSFSRTIKSRWATHTTIQGKPKSEYLGADLQSVTFNIVLDVTLGLKPQEMLDTLAKMAEGKTVNALIIGGKVLGNFILSSLSETREVIYNGGQLARCNVSLTLDEYA